MTTHNLLACATAVVTLSACSSTDTVASRFDERTGVTWMALSTPIAMAHEVRDVSTAARDYLYVGPIEMNERGVREEYLWLGLATTMPIALSDELASLPSSLLLEIDDLVFELPLVEWDDPAPYETAASVMQSMTARVSIDQIALIASANHVRAELVHTDGSSTAYDHWNGAWVDWVEFRDAVDPLSGNRPSVASY